MIGNAGQSNYAASKAALIGFTKSVAKELAPRGVTSAIAPGGFIETDMTAVLDEKVREAILEARANDPIRFTGRYRPHGGVFGHGTDRIHDWTGAHRRWWHGHVNELFGIRGLTAIPPVLKEPANVTAAYV